MGAITWEMSEGLREERGEMGGVFGYDCPSVFATPETKELSPCTDVVRLCSQHYPGNEYWESYLIIYL
jgi:hypothetical protein